MLVAWSIIIIGLALFTAVCFRRCVYLLVASLVPFTFPISAVSVFHLRIPTGVALIIWILAALLITSALGVTAIYRARAASKLARLWVAGVCLVWLIGTSLDVSLLVFWSRISATDPNVISPDSSKAVHLTEMKSFTDSQWSVRLSSPRLLSMVTTLGPLGSDSWTAKRATVRWSRDASIVAVYDKTEPLFAFQFSGSCSGRRLPLDSLAWRADNSNTWHQLQSFLR
jgi:hypothetical protein